MQEILVIGQLNFAADNLSLSRVLYCEPKQDRVGEATILFRSCKKSPTRLESDHDRGSLRFGFQPLMGDDVAIAIVQDRAPDPTTGTGLEPGAGTEWVSRRSK